MAVSVVMPALEMAQETGKLVSWLKQEGEQVRKGEMLLEVETDKAVMEIEAAADGVLAGVTARPGDVVHVGHTIAWLVQPGEPLPAAEHEGLLLRSTSPLGGSEGPLLRAGSPSPVAAAAAAAPPTVAAPARGAEAGKSRSA